jgi:RNA polymerase sigma-70 factor (ECF subfamily)
MDGRGDTEDRFGRLMGEAQAGDRDSYRCLLREIAPILRRALRRRLPFLPAADIEDLVQDVLLSVHAVRATYDPARPFRPWLMAIARNRLADMARRYARRSPEVAVDTYPEISDAEQTNTVGSFGHADALRQAVAALPRGQRLAIELLKLRELSLKEAAAASGMSIAALKVASHRATRALRLMLKERSG